MVELIKNSQHIIQKIEELERGRKSLEEAAHLKARSAGEYEKELAITILKLRNGVKMALESENIENIPVSVMERVARGLCWEKAIERDKQEALYKNLIKSLDCIQAELNGFQSINRFLSDAP